jgi:hypothetical protein
MKVQTLLKENTNFEGFKYSFRVSEEWPSQPQDKEKNISNSVNSVIKELYSLSFSIKEILFNFDGTERKFKIEFKDVSEVVNLGHFHDEIKKILKNNNLIFTMSDEYIANMTMMFPGKIGVRISAFQRNNGWATVVVYGNSLKDVHKRILNAEELVIQNEINSSVLGLILMSGTSIRFRSNQIIEDNPWLDLYVEAMEQKMDVLEFKAMLIENGMSHLAKL